MKRPLNLVEYRGVNIFYRLSLENAENDEFYITRHRVTHRFNTIDAAMDYVDRTTRED